MQYQIEYGCVSHIGCIRKMNQDNFLCDGHFLQVQDDHTEFPFSGVKSSKDCPLFGVFDGMGGEECGEMAAYIAAKSAAELSVGKKAAAELSQFCQTANAAICDYANNHDVSSMGTTAAMLAFTAKGVTLCNIGDSKVFRFCDGELEQISKDHVAVSAFGMKPPLSQNLGIPPTELIIDPYLAQGAYHPGDVYLICSDGLTDMVEKEDIARVLEKMPVAEAVSELLRIALEHGGKDNITIIGCQIRRRSLWHFLGRRRR